MASPTLNRQSQHSKRPSSLILPERKSKRQHKKLTDISTENGSFTTSFSAHDLDDAHTISSTKLRKNRPTNYFDDQPEYIYIDITDDDLGSLDKKDPKLKEHEIICIEEDNNKSCCPIADSIDLTPTSTMNIPSISTLTMSPSFDNNLSSFMTEHLGPTSDTEPQHILTPETTQTTASKRRKSNKGEATKSFDHYIYSTPINEIHQSYAPNYDSLTIVELRNAVKKYGFKVKKDRQSMITLLQDLWVSTNKNRPTPGTLCLPPPEPNLDGDPPLNHSKKLEFATRVKNDVPLWERILRYENVDMKTCTDGLARKDKAAFHEYLDENALLYKPPPKSK